MFCHFVLSCLTACKVLQSFVNNSNQKNVICVIFDLEENKFSYIRSITNYGLLTGSRHLAFDCVEDISNACKCNFLKVINRIALDCVMNELFILKVDVFSVCANVACVVW